VSLSVPVPPPEDPVRVIREWLDEATREAVQRHPNTMTLATVAASGQPSARVVLLKDLSVADGYVVFHTHYESRKSVELRENNQAAAVIHWDRLGRQVRLEGLVVRSPTAESDEYFATRPWRSQINAWTSEQSRPLGDPDELDDRAREKAQELGLADLDDSPENSRPGGLSRPEFWGGYRLWFAAVELWMEGPDRFHERLRYERSVTSQDEHTFQTGPWSVQRLQP